MYDFKEYEDEVENSRMTADKIKDDKPFICNDFIVVDDKARVTLLKASLY